MYRSFLSVKNISRRPLQSILMIGMTSIVTALTLLVLLLALGVYKAFDNAVSPFQIIIGSKGSSYQLLLNSVFLLDRPLNNFSYDEILKLKEDPLVENVVVLGFGDNYLGHRIIGTEKNIFNYKIKKNAAEWIEIKDGRTIEKPFEAVIGVGVLENTGLKVGDRFRSSHGLVQMPTDDHHEDHKDEYLVVGIMKKVNGPYDRAILVDIKDIWTEHGQNLGSVTSAIIRPTGYKEAMQLAYKYQNNKELQLMFPAQQIIRFFSLLGNGEKILKIIVGIIFCISLIIMGISAYWSAISNSKERGILRILGARKKDTIYILLGENIILILIGIIVGEIMGHSIFFLMAHLLGSKTAIMISNSFSSLEVYVVLIMIILDIFAALIPIALVTRKDLLEDL